MPFFVKRALISLLVLLLLYFGTSVIKNGKNKTAGYFGNKKGKKIDSGKAEG